MTEAPAQRDDREHRRAAVRAGKGDRETGDTERLVQRECQRDVERVLEAVQVERCARVLQRVERAQREQVDRERHQAQRESRHGVRDHGGVTAGERTPLEEGDDHGPGQRDEDRRARHDDEGRQPKPEGQPVAQFADIAATGRAGHLRRQRRHEGDGEQPVRKLEERVGTQVDERPAVAAVGEDEHDPERDLVRDDVAEGPRGEASHRDDGAMPPREHEPEADPGPPQDRTECEGHRGDACGRAHTQRDEERSVVAHAVERDRTFEQTRQ